MASIADTDFRMNLFELALRSESVESFTEGALIDLRAASGASWLALVRGEKGRWRILTDVGRRQPLPAELLADVLDRQIPTTNGVWRVVPLSDHGDSSELLAAWGAERLPDGLLDPAGPLLGHLIGRIRKQSAAARRNQRLEAILKIAATWNQTHDLNTLLEEMAKAATRLLGSERASIFLWDKKNKTLVGRPALGVDSGELRIPDNTGIVGQVLSSGRPRRVDADVEGEQAEIDRRVDQQLDFRTQSLLCVPLVGSNDELFGAFELINKIGGNFTADDEDALLELAHHAAIALENTREREQLLAARDQMTAEAAAGAKLIGECPPIEALRSTVRRVAGTELSVLILGENGTGKEVVSRMIHYLSERRSQPFVAVNCAALTESLLESELFGHEKGAFTDAHEARAGKFELASGGTLFLDEIGEMSQGGQAKLLRVLEEKVVVRVGGSKSIHTDVRVFAATNRDLAALVRERKFREDLFFRLNVVTLEMPPLRQRGDDVLLLADHFMSSFSADAGRKPPRFTAAARKRLLSHSWPGNVRELRNLMERLAYLSQGDRIDTDELAFIISPSGSPGGLFDSELPLSEATRQFQIEYITQIIDRARGNVTEAARLLGVHRSNLYRKMRQLGMETDGPP